MIAAMDVFGNPSSVHAEGRAAKSLVERSRAEIATAFGADGADVVFVSGATEAASMACSGRTLVCADIEHDAVVACAQPSLPVSQDGQVSIDDVAIAALQAANSETGILQDLPQGLAVVDATQAFGKVPFAFNWIGCQMALISAHKIGGPKGIGALVVKRGTEVPALIKGGGQEMGRRSGTENVIGIAGFAAAAMAAQRDLEANAWAHIEKLRNILEEALEHFGKETIFVGKSARRLPNTSCFATAGWKGETQVMQMDLAGFAVSAGSACSSGKVRASRVLRAMGYEDDVASSAIRVSLGLETTEQDVMRFAEMWGAKHEKKRSRAV